MTERLAAPLPEPRTADLFGESLPHESGADATRASAAAAHPHASVAHPSSAKPTARGKTVLAPAHGAELVALAQRLPAGLFLGTSTWSYGGWNGIVYDGEFSDNLLARKGLEAYSAHPLLRAAGIDRGFYAPIPLADYMAYAAQVPETFRFLVKAPASVCDPWLRASNGAGRLANPAFLDATIATRDFIEPATAGLGAKCGPLLFQLSPLGSMATDSASFLAKLEAFLRALPPLDPAITPSACHAVELRDADLLTPRFIKLLRTLGVRFCVSARERMPAIARQAPAHDLLDEARPGPLVLRWMLRGGYSYAQAEAAFSPFGRLVAEDPETRHAIADLVARTLEAGQTACVIVSNKAEGSAPLTCVRLAEAIAGRLGV